MKKKKTVKTRMLSLFLVLLLLTGSVSSVHAEEAAGTEAAGSETTKEQIVESEESVSSGEQGSVPGSAESTEAGQNAEGNTDAEKSDGTTAVSDEDKTEEEIQPIEISGPMMEITEEDLNSNAYEIYYYVEDITYTYGGQVVTFVSETEIEAGGKTYALKNKKTTITVAIEEDGNICISLEGVTTPIGSVPSKWNVQFGGCVQSVYKTDIPGMEEVRSEKADELKNLKLGKVPAGTYHLTEGTIYEKANEWSPGIDFEDGNGIVKEGYFGTLPDITFTVKGKEPEPEPEKSDLKKLEVEGGILEPEFSTDCLRYNLKVPHGTKTVTLKGSPVSVSPTIVVMGNTIAQPGGKFGEPLPVEDGAQISVMVSGTSYITYNLFVKEEPGDAVEPQEPSLSDCGFSFALDGEVLAITEDGVHEDGTLYGKVEIPKGTENITMLRAKETEALNQGLLGNTFIQNGVGEAVFPTAEYIGKDNYFIVKTKEQKYYIYLEEKAKPDTPQPPISKPDGYIGVATSAKVYEDFENDIWLQYQQKEMQVGDTASLYPWRVPQIVSNPIANDVFRPNFQFEIISGDSVILDTAASNKKATVTAEKPGTSIVKVTYDAADYGGTHCEATSAVNTAYAVFTVGETGKAVIETNDAFKNWRHYDTIYYTEGETVPYTFTVDTENTTNVRVTVNGITIKGNGNKYTANLENRSNIIGIEATDSDGNIKSMYRVIDARFMEVIVENKTNPEQPLQAGDTANISFKGITMPVYKLASIYNPQMGKNATRIIYENETLGTFEGKCRQWDLATKNDFDVTFAEEGAYTFHSEQGIYCTWWGSPLGSDITAEGSGEPNLNAPTLKGNFSVLPDFTIEVAGKDGEQPGKPEEPEQPDKKPTEEDIAAANKVMEQIAKLGSHVTLVQESQVLTVRAAYNKLTSRQQELVENYDVLVAAEDRIQLIKDILAEKPTLNPSEPEKDKKDNLFEQTIQKVSAKNTAKTVSGSVKQTGRKSSGTQSNTTKVNAENHRVTADNIEAIKGQDKNLRITDSFADGIEYTMTINGKDVKTSVDMNTGITKESAYEEEIGLLAPDPEIFVFEQEGVFPAEVLVEIPVEKEDGEYLLFRYNQEKGKAEYKQKVIVKDGRTKFILSEGGDYFIDKKAKTKSIGELTDETGDEEVLFVDNIEAQGMDYKTLLLGIFIGLGGASVFGAGFLFGRRKRS